MPTSTRITKPKREFIMVEVNDEVKAQVAFTATFHGLTMREVMLEALLSWSEEHGLDALHHAVDSMYPRSIGVHLARAFNVCAVCGGEDNEHNGEGHLAEARAVYYL